MRKASQSGGIFTAISDSVLNSGGVVYGCALDSRYRAVHIRAADEKKRNQMRGSKYVQSDTNNTFPQVRYDLETGRAVLFTGTSCQVAALQGYLKHDYTNLICMDIICQGVPSPKVWADYIAWQESRHKSRCTKVNFRNKEKHGWATHFETLAFENGKEYDGQIYKELFHGRRAQRPCCYECPYKSMKHPGDITFADFWGIEKAVPNYKDEYGVSLVLVNTEKGSNAFNAVKNEIDWTPSKLQDCIQPMLVAPSRRPKNRDVFWNDYEKLPFALIAKKYGGFGLVGSIKKKVCRTLLNIKKCLNNRTKRRKRG